MLTSSDGRRGLGPVLSAARCNSRLIGPIMPKMSARRSARQLTHPFSQFLYIMDGSSDCWPDPGYDWPPGLTESSSWKPFIRTSGILKKSMHRFATDISPICYPYHMSATGHLSPLSWSTSTDGMWKNASHGNTTVIFLVRGGQLLKLH